MDQGRERTEEATPKHRAKVRALGQVARSQLAGPALSMLLIGPLVAVLLASAGAWQRAFVTATQACARGGTSSDVTSLLHLARTIVFDAQPQRALAIAWFAALSVSCAASLACGSIGFAPGAIVPRLARLTASTGLRRLANPENLWSAGACTLLVALLAWVAVPRLVAALVAAAQDGSLAAALGAIVHGATTAWSRAMALLLSCAVLDIALSRKRFTAGIRMTPRELRDEREETEARPESKQRRRTIGARRARSLRIAAIRKASAVITNPTHVAVALRYAPPELDVPTVVALGADLRARILRAAARAFEVPIIESADLARRLYATVDIDEPIPEECYAAVAAIFAWIVRTRGVLPGADRELS